MDHPRPWLRIVDASDLEDTDIEFEKLPVRTASGDKLGRVDGFVVDVDSGRPYYVVVDAGGWFKSKDFLLPIGHAHLDADRDAIVADLTRDHVKNFPGFDKGEFQSLTTEDLNRMNDQTAEACCVTDVTVTAWERPHYQQPDWWRSEYARPAGQRERAGGSREAAAAHDRPSKER
jgi:hypothetical protein